jgi:glucokinase
VENGTERPVLAVDLGGTQIRAALITPDLSVHARRAVPTGDDDGVAAVLDRIARTAAEVRDEAAAAGLPSPIGISVSSPGPLDPWRGIVRAPPNLAGWHDVPVAAHVAAALDLPVFLERDTNVAVLAEWRYGAARGATDVIYITVSTGIGGGIISSGRPLTGSAGTAGEIGHHVIAIDGPVCGCGGVGHAEAIASGTAIARDAQALLDAGVDPDSPLARLAASEGSVGARIVAQAAAEGDAACQAILERAWVAIGALCGSLVNLFSPEVIVIGGSIAEHHARLFEVARAELPRRAFPVLLDRVRIVPAALGRDVSLIGGLPIVNDRIDDPAFATGLRPQQGAIRQ